jgi:hypothetical protein
MHTKFLLDTYYCTGLRLTWVTTNKDKKKLGRFEKNKYIRQFLAQNE